jgi:hypothetical protein
MSGPQHRFDPAELRVPGEPEPSVAELADVLAAARGLEALGADAGIRPTAGFEDRVMAAISVEPAPRLVAAPVSTVRGGVFGAFLVTVRESWAVATSGGRPAAVRAQALAFVLLVIVATGAMAGAGAVTVGALLGQDGTTVEPDRTSNPTTPSDDSLSPTSLEPTEPPESSEPTESAEPGETESAEPGETAEPTETAEPDKTPTAGETPRPARTPRPTETPDSHETPEPNDTPEPNETPRGTDDHSGGGGGSDG